VKRRGFTLIELMVVIAIIIILAAIAIPNYLSMTKRAKRSRVASDFAALATALETYRTDWNAYPIQSEALAIAGATTPEGNAYKELIGAGTGTVNNGAATAAGETGPIVYMTANILKSMVNPYSNATGNEYMYSSDTTGATWKLTAATLDDAKPTLERTDLITTLTDTPSAP